MKIYLFLIGCLFLVASVTQAQTSLVLTAESSGQSFHVTTGTPIEVHLPPFGEMYVSYNPTMLQFVSHNPPMGVTMETSVESGVVFPEDVQSSEPVILPAPGEPGPMPALEMTPEVNVIQPVGGMAVAEPAVQGVSVTSGEDGLGLWQFRVIGAGTTMLEFRTFYPPCNNDLCPMMPDYSLQYTLVITGNSIAPEPVPADGELVHLGMNADGQTIPVQTGQIVALDLDESAYNIIYNPDAAVYLPGSVPRFLVLAAGFTTRLGVQLGDALIFQVTLEIPPLCDSCDVMRELIQVEQVEGSLMMSYPVRVILTIHAVGPSSCTDPILFDEQRSGNLISVQVYRVSGGICTADHGAFTINYALQEGLESGNYTIEVNGYRFDVQI
jgi:hypothetical protein